MIDYLPDSEQEASCFVFMDVCQVSFDSCTAKSWMSVQTVKDQAGPSSSKSIKKTSRKGQKDDDEVRMAGTSCLHCY